MRAAIAKLIETSQCDPYCGCGYSGENGNIPCGDASNLLAKLQARDDFDQYFEFDGNTIIATSQKAVKLSDNIRYKQL